jgi:hypothetical protein
MSERPIDHIIAEIISDREIGTEDAWWRSQIGDFVLDESYGEDEDVNGGQDYADRRRILRLPEIERALVRAAALQAQLADARAVIAEIASQTKGVTPEPENLQMAIGSIHSYAQAFLTK